MSQASLLSEDRSRVYLSCDVKGIKYSVRFQGVGIFLERRHTASWVFMGHIRGCGRDPQNVQVTDLDWPIFIDSHQFHKRRRGDRDGDAAPTSTLPGKTKRVGGQRGRMARLALSFHRAALRREGAVQTEVFHGPPSTRARPHDTTGLTNRM